MSGTDTTSERRAEPRFPLFLPASARCGAGAARVHLRNLSRSGALAEALRPPPARGSAVTLSRDGLLAQAEVMWTQGPRFGLRFDEPLDPDALLAQLRGGR